MSTQKILIIDDDPTTCDIIAENLTQQGFEAIQALNGEHGVTLAENKDPDCILLDWSLPGMNGIQVLKQLKENTATKDIPVIMLTAKTEISNISESLTYGALDYIVKPFDHENMVDRVRAILSQE